MINKRTQVKVGGAGFNYIDTRTMAYIWALLGIFAIQVSIELPFHLWCCVLRESERERYRETERH